MDSKILYKALDMKKKWVYGIPHPAVKNTFICESDGSKVEVDDESVCRYIGFCSYTSTMIFTGDIVQCEASGKDIFGIVRFGLYENKHYGFYIEWPGDRYDLRNDVKYWCERGVFVVGNINTDEFEKFCEVS